MKKIEITNENVIKVVQASCSNTFEKFKVEVYWDELTKKNREFIKHMKGDFKIITANKGKVPINLQNKVRIEPLYEDLNHKAIKLLEKNDDRVEVYNALVDSQISPFYLLAVIRNHSIYDSEVLKGIAEFIPYVFKCNTQYLYGYLSAKVKPKSKRDYGVYIKSAKKVKDKTAEGIKEKLKEEYHMSKREVELLYPHFIVWSRNEFLTEINFTKKECKFLNIKNKKEEIIKEHKKIKTLMDF